jgi:hypothetical protein
LRTEFDKSCYSLEGGKSRFPMKLKGDKIIFIGVIIMAVIIIVSSGMNIKAYPARNMDNSTNYNWSPDILLSDVNGTDIRPSISVSSTDNLHLAWLHQALNETRIAYAKSINGGTNWSEAQYFTADPPNGAYSIDWMEINSADEEIVDIAYWPFLFRSVEQPIYHFRSTDSGENWSTHVQAGWGKPCTFCLVSNVSEAYIITPYNGFYDGNLYKGIFPNQTWTRVYHEPYQYNYSWKTDTATLTKEGIHLLGNISGEDVLRHYVSKDSAVTWSGGEIVASTDFQPLEVASSNTTIAYIGFMDNNTKLGIVWSTDNGRTWRSPVNVASLKSVSNWVGTPVSITLDLEGNAHFVWQDVVGDDWEILYSNISLITGENSEIVRLTNFTGYSMHPDIVVDSYGYVHVVWEDNRSGEWKIYYKRCPGEDISCPEIAHDPNVAQINTGTAIQIDANIKDNTEVERCGVWYKGNGEEFIELDMNIGDGTNKNGTWQAYIPPQTTNRSIQYYLQATDSSGNMARLPTNGYFEIEVNDTISPLLMHTPVNATVGGQPISIYVNASDNFQVKQVFLIYFEMNTTSEISINMTLQSGTYSNGTWTADIPVINNNTIIKYYFIAIDDNGNSAQIPSDTTVPFIVEIIDSSSNVSARNLYGMLGINNIILLVFIVCISFIVLTGYLLRNKKMKAEKREYKGRDK